MKDWINWEEHPAPEDVRGIFIKYEDGFICCDLYCRESKKRKYRSQKIISWRFMERTDPNEKTIQCSVPGVE